MITVTKMVINGENVKLGVGRNIDLNRSQELEQQALALVRQYGVFLRPAKSFLRELADFLGWENLKKEL